MSNSPLVSYTKISPNKTVPRNHAIDTLTIHMVVGQATVERLGDIFTPVAKQASSNYGVGLDGRIGMYVEEKDRSWCSSSRSNDHRAITIEVASDNFAPYKVTDSAYKGLLELCVDICKRNGKKKLIWFGDKDKTLGYSPKSDEMVMTVHRWFANTSCPGEYLMSKMADIAAYVNEKLNPVQPTVPTVTLKSDSPIYTTAANAINHVNPVGTYKAGEYFVFRYYTYKSKNDTVNITKQPGQAGGWIAVADLDDVYYTTQAGDTVEKIRGLNPVDLIDALKVEAGQKIKLK